MCIYIYSYIYTYIFINSGISVGNKSSDIKKNYQRNDGKVPVLMDIILLGKKYNFAKTVIIIITIIIIIIIVIIIILSSSSSLLLSLSGATSKIGRAVAVTMAGTAGVRVLCVG
jgi:uncharacterized membrane protein YvbJ